MASFEALLQRDRPNSMARLDNPPSGPVVDLHPKLAIVGLAAKSQPRATEACRYLGVIASQMATMDIVLRASEIATQLVRFEPMCVRDVAAVVPERVDQYIALPYAKEVCETEDWPACDQLTRQPR